MPRPAQRLPRQGEAGAPRARATRLFVPGMGLLIAALGLILCAALGRAEGGASRPAAEGLHAAVPP